MFASHTPPHQRRFSLSAAMVHQRPAMNRPRMRWAHSGAEGRERVLSLRVIRLRAIRLCVIEAVGGRVRWLARDSSMTLLESRSVFQPGLR